MTHLDKTPEEHPWAFDLPFVFFAWLLIVYTFCQGCGPASPSAPTETTWAVDEPSPDPPAALATVVVLWDDGRVEAWRGPVRLIGGRP